MQNEIYIGIMTGTSIDGVDVVIARFDPAPKVISYYEHQIPSDLSQIIVELATAESVNLDQLTRSHFVLVELYAEAVRGALNKANLNEKDITAIGLHGQTIRHVPKRKKLSNELPKVGGTFQLGSGVALAALTGIDVVSDFRSADVALGGEGAPLVPMFDSRFLRSDTVARIILNLGGIANITFLPPKSNQVIAFDTGPGNMLIDMIAKQRFSVGFDDGGMLARRGDVEYNYLNDMLDEPYFKLPPPKSTGRELFNETFAERFTHKLSPNDALATATELTARSIAMALEFLPLHESIGSAGVPPATRNAGGTPAVRESFEIIASGGGVRNGYLMERIAENIPSATIRLSDEYGIPSQSKEALAFAWFAKSFMENEIIHLPKTTGAREAVILGSLSKGRK